MEFSYKGEKMNKKILIIGIIAAFMIVTVSFAAAINAEGKANKKESPLYKKNVKLALGEKFEYIKTKFIVGRIFFAPNIHLFRQSTITGWTDTYPMPTACAPTCFTCIGLKC